MVAGGEVAKFQNMMPQSQHSSSREDMIIEVEVQVLLDIPQQEATTGGSARSSSCPHPASTSRNADFVPSGLQCGNPSSPPQFSLPQERFCSLFPFHILLDSYGMLVQVSFAHGLELVVFGLPFSCFLKLFLLCAPDWRPFAACLQRCSRHQDVPRFSAFQGETPSIVEGHSLLCCLHCLAHFSLHW